MNLLMMSRLFIVFALLGGLTFGQSNAGSITGILMDQTGAVVPGTEVVITQFIIDDASTTHIGDIGERLGSVEAIGEFKVLSNTYSAEYGRTSGGTVQFQLYPFVRPIGDKRVLLFGQRDPRKIAPWFPDFNVRSKLGIRQSIGETLLVINISGGLGNFGHSQYQDWGHQPVGTSNITTYLRGRHTMRFGAQLYQNQFLSQIDMVETKSMFLPLRETPV